MELKIQFLKILSLHVNLIVMASKEEEEEEEEEEEGDKVKREIAAMSSNLDCSSEFSIKFLKICCEINENNQLKIKLVLILSPCLSL